VKVYVLSGLVNPLKKAEGFSRHSTSYGPFALVKELAPRLAKDLGIALET
jgi:hypothetical protein